MKASSRQGGWLELAWKPATRAVQPREASEKTMSRKTILMIVAAAMFAAGPRTAKGQAYTCKNLFQLTVPSGYYIGRVSGISADGSQVVGIEGQNQSGFSFAICGEFQVFMSPR